MALQYGLNNAVDFESSKIVSFASVLSRTAGQPMDKSQLWYPLDGKTGFERACEYAATASAYVGQELAVVDVIYEEDGETVKGTSVKFYGIQDAEGTLKELGALAVGDESTIVVAEDGTISLSGIEELVFERDVLGEDSQPTGEKEEIKYQPLLTKEGLTWVEPSKTTVEGLAVAIASLEAAVDKLEKDVSTNTAAITAEASAREAADATLETKIAEALAEAKKYADDNDTDTVYDDTELTARVKAIEDDYLKEADKYDDTALAGRVTTIESTIGNETSGMKADIAANAKAVTDEAAARAQGDTDTLTAAKDYTDIQVEGIKVAIEAKDGAQHIVIKNAAGEEVTSVDATAFVKDGMLDSAVYNTDTKKLTLTWNTDAGKNATEIDLNDLVNTYKGSEHIIVETDGTIKVADDVALDSDLTALETTLKATIDTKRTEAEVNEQIDAKITAANLGQYAKAADVETSLGGKADKSTVETLAEEVALKAVKADVEAALAEKVNTAAYEADMATVAKTEAVDSQFEAVGQRIDLVEAAIGAKATDDEPATGIYADIDAVATEAEKTYATKEALTAVEKTAGNAATKADSLETRLDGIVAQGGEPNTINTIKVNGAALTVDAQKAVDIVGTAVVAEVKLENLQDGADWTTKINKNTSDITALGTRVSETEQTVSGHGSAISTLATKVSALETEVKMESESRIDALEGIVSGDGETNTGLVGKVATHTTDITNLKAKDTELEAEIDANTTKLAGISGTVKDYVDNAVGGVDLSQLATKSEVEAGDQALSTAVDNKLAAKVDTTTFETYKSDTATLINTKANATDVFTKEEAAATFMTEAQVDARLNTLIDSANSEDTIKNVTNLIEFVHDNAGDIAELVTKVDNNTNNIATLDSTVKANTSAIETNTTAIAALATRVTNTEVKDSSEISVTAAGEGATGVVLGIKEVNISKLVQTEGDVLVLNGGSATA